MGVTIFEKVYYDSVNQSYSSIPDAKKHYSNKKNGSLIEKQKDMLLKIVSDNTLLGASSITIKDNAEFIRKNENIASYPVLNKIVCKEKIDEFIISTINRKAILDLKYNPLENKNKTNGDEVICELESVLSSLKKIDIGKIDNILSEKDEFSYEVYSLGYSINKKVKNILSRFELNPVNEPYDPVELKLLRMIDNPELRPPPYIPRGELSSKEHFTTYYSCFSSKDVHYQDYLSKIDPKLTRSLRHAGYDLPTKSTRTDRLYKSINSKLSNWVSSYKVYSKNRKY